MCGGNITYGIVTVILCLLVIQYTYPHVLGPWRAGGLFPALYPSSANLTSTNPTHVHVRLRIYGGHECCDSGRSTQRVKHADDIPCYIHYKHNKCGLRMETSSPLRSETK